MPTIEKAEKILSIIEYSDKNTGNNLFMLLF